MGPCGDTHTLAGQAGHVAGTLPCLCIIHGAGKPQASSVWGQLLLQTPLTSSKMPSSPALGGGDGAGLAAAILPIPCPEQGQAHRGCRGDITPGPGGAVRAHGHPTRKKGMAAGVAAMPTCHKPR